jgi:hypothetical protein
MQIHLRKMACLVVALAVAGCAVTPQQFAQRKNTMTDTEVCQAARSARQSGDANYVRGVNDEGYRRGLTVDRCNALVAQADRDGAIAAVALAGMAALALASHQNGNAAAPAPAGEYAWVRALNAQRRPIWECREVKTGKLEEPYHCKDLAKPGRD